MTANASAHAFRVYIGVDEQDWSKQYNGFDPGYPQRDRSGLFTYTGTLEILGNWQAPESINPRVNQARWFRGQVIRIEITDSSGTFVPHPVGLFYILTEPEPPSKPLENEDPVLTLEIGCILALRDFAKPEADESGNDVGVVVDRTTLIGSKLASAGVTATWVGSVPDYPLNYPVLNEGGSYVALAGELAYSGLKGLRQNSQGQIVTVDLRTPDLLDPLLVVTIGHDEIVYKSAAGSEPPCEQITGCGVSYDVVDTWVENLECTNAYTPGTAEITRKVCTYDAADETTEVHRVTVREPLGLLLPRDYPGVGTFALSSDTIETKYYEPGPNGKLLQERKQVFKLFAVALSEFWNGLSDSQKASYFPLSEIEYEDTIVYYEYTDKESLKVREARTRQPLGVILPDVDPTTTAVSFLIPAAVSGERYEEISPGTWRYIPYEAAPRIQVNPDSLDDDATITEKVQLVTTTNTPPSVSHSGQNQPPNCDRRPDRYARTEKQLKGPARFGTFAGSNQQERERTIEVKWATSEAQLSELAQIEGATLIGRRQGQEIQLPLSDEWLENDDPCPIVHCREPRFVIVGDDKELVYDTIIYRVDALQYIHDRTRAQVAFLGIWLATIPAGETEPVLPYRPTVILQVITPTITLSASPASFNLGSITRTVVTPSIYLSAAPVNYFAGITRTAITPTITLSSATLDTIYTGVSRTAITPTITLSSSLTSSSRSLQRSVVTPSITLSAGAGTTPTDSDYALELLFEGADGSTTFLDTSSYGRTITAVGNAQISTARAAQGSSSGLFDGATDYLQFTWSGPALTGDFTLSAYVYPVVDADLEIFSIGNDSIVNLLFELNTGRSLRLSVRSDGGSSYCDFNSPDAAITLNTWQLVTAQIVGGTATLLINGISVGSASISTSRTQGLTIARVGRLISAVPRDFNGNIDALTISIP